MSGETGPIDQLDAVLVRALLQDARATLAALAQASGLSVSAVQARVRRLEKRGVITGYRAQVAAEAVGMPLAAFIEISPLDPAHQDLIPTQLEGLCEIEACHSVAGDAAYILFVRVAGPGRLEELIRQIRDTAQVTTRTTVVLQTYFEERPPMVLTAEE
ncbi:MAG: Lrp/AsnC family transcriptional regulator [Propionibacteriaceae bacterium]|jgi:Lrp/AsnC family leucine-responsive transcriptional regulator|nr:Lrp/AsnC family transcriptional regulator [Propionibacteriaceae bacterium]